MSGDGAELVEERNVFVGCPSFALHPLEKLFSSFTVPFPANGFPLVDSVGKKKGKKKVSRMKV